MPLNYAIPVFSTVASWSLPFLWHCRRLLGRLLFLPEERSTNAGTSKIEHNLIKAIAGEIWSAPITPMTHNASVGQIMNHMLKTDGLVFISLPLLLLYSKMLFFGQVRRIAIKSFNSCNIIVLLSKHDVLCWFRVNHQSFKSSFTMKCEIDNHSCYLVRIYLGKKPFWMFFSMLYFYCHVFFTCPKFCFIHT